MKHKYQTHTHTQASVTQPTDNEVTSLMKLLDFLAISRRQSTPPSKYNPICDMLSYNVQNDVMPDLQHVHTNQWSDACYRHCKDTIDNHCIQHNLLTYLYIQSLCQNSTKTYMCTWSSKMHLTWHSRIIYWNIGGIEGWVDLRSLVTYWDG